MSHDLSDAYNDMVFFRESIKEYDSLIIENPDYTYLFFERGKAYFDLVVNYRCLSEGEIDLAIDFAIANLTIFIKKNATNSAALCKRGDAYLKKYFYMYEHMEQSPVNKDDYNTYPRDWYFNLAIMDYNTSLNFDKTNQSVYSNIGMAYYENSFKEKKHFHLSLAIEYLEKYLSYNFDLEVCLKLGLSYYQMYEINNKLNFLKKALSNIIPVIILKIEFGYNLIHDLECDVIISCFTTAMKIMQNKGYFYVYRGISYMLKTYKYESKAYYEEREYGLDEDGYDDKGEVEKFSKLAISDLLIALTLMPDNIYVYRKLSALYRERYNSRCSIRRREEDKIYSDKYEQIACDIERKFKVTVEQTLDLEREQSGVVTRSKLQAQPVPQQVLSVGIADRNTTDIATEILQGKKLDIQFGDYKWRVLALQGDKALIITEDVIDERPYHEEPALFVTWETCTLRKYLNGEFLQKFTIEQRVKIIETHINNSDNLWYGTWGGNETQDKVFLLSLQEVDRYFGDSGDYQNRRRKNFCCVYGSLGISAYNNGTILSNAFDCDRESKLGNDNYNWRLRSPGEYGSRTALVDDDGYVRVCGSCYGGYVESSCGVRPALWLNLKT